MYFRGFRERQDITRAQPPIDNRVPLGWSSDELSKFWEAGRKNQFATFVKKRPVYKRLVAIDALFLRVSKDWLNPPDDIAAMLFLRTHSAFRTAAGLAAAGQAAESYMINRTMLEYAAYALHLNRNPELKAIWLDRHLDEKTMTASKNGFSHRKVVKSVSDFNQHAGTRFSKLYQHTIDFGGHPNERSVTGNLEVVEEADRRTMLMIMQHGDGPALDFALRTTAQCGMCSLEMLQGVFNARFELLGINAAMLELRRGL
ncbi:MAG TPA: hypothetical protein VHR67_06385 [Aestuariivirgaceae bacterium]|jgi:hypothetical protein|nr:hypothetical protein [Aestuariivirgaceae bacterium]